MAARRHVLAPLALCWAALALTTLVGCKPEIGDACERSTDCSVQGERTCDLSTRVDGDGNRSQTGDGECIIENCSLGTCPDEGLCVVVYGNDALSIACDPTREDVASGTNEDPLPPLDDCRPNERCLPEGLCADGARARTSCRRECNKDRDCRDGYQCTETGQNGVYVAPDPDRPNERLLASICTPKPLSDP